MPSHITQQPVAARLPTELIRHIISYVVDEHSLSLGHCSYSWGTLLAVLLTSQEFHQHTIKLMFEEKPLNVYISSENPSYSKYLVDPKCETFFEQHPRHANSAFPWHRFRKIIIHLKPSFSWDAQASPLPQAVTFDVANDLMLNRVEGFLDHLKGRERVRLGIATNRLKVHILFYEADGLLQKNRVADGTNLSSPMPFWTLTTLATVYDSYLDIRNLREIPLLPGGFVREVFHLPNIASVNTKGSQNTKSFMRAWDRSAGALLNELLQLEDEGFKREYMNYSDWLAHADGTEELECFLVEGLNAHGSQLACKKLVPLDHPKRTECLDLIRRESPDEIQVDGLALLDKAATTQASETWETESAHIIAICKQAAISEAELDTLETDMARLRKLAVK